jgi:hypothetical protein
MLRQAGLRRTEGSTARSVQPSPSLGVPLSRPARTLRPTGRPARVPAHHAGSSRPALRRISRWRPATPIAVPGAKAQFKTMFLVKPAASVACCRGRLAQLGPAVAPIRSTPCSPSATLRPPPLGALLAPPGPRWEWLQPSSGLPRPGTPTWPSRARSGPSRVPRRIRVWPPSRPPRRSGTGPGQPRCTPPGFMSFRPARPARPRVGRHPARFAPATRSHSAGCGR